MKKALILVAGESNLPFIEAAKKEGLYLITCDTNRTNPGHALADENLFIDVYDYKAVIEAVKEKNIDGVMSFVSAHGLTTASKVSEYFHLKGYSQNALETLINKGLFRDFLSRNDLNFPAYQYVHNVNEIDLKQLSYPVIIKPTDSGGSQGVIKIESEDELLLNFQTAKNFSDSGTVIIEEFLEGQELINGDCLVYNGEIIGDMVGNYMYDNETNNVLPIATLFPAKQDVSNALEQITKIIKTLNIPDGIINFEAIVKNNVPYIIEINPRPSGNYIWKLMSYKYSIDIPSFVVNLYFNSENPIKKLEASNEHTYAYQLIYTDENKLFEGFDIPSSLEHNILELIFFKQKNERVSSFNNLYDRIGIVLLEFKEDEKAKSYTNILKLFKI